MPEYRPPKRFPREAQGSIDFSRTRDNKAARWTVHIVAARPGSLQTRRALPQGPMRMPSECELRTEILTVTEVRRANAYAGLIEDRYDCGDTLRNAACAHLPFDSCCLLFVSNNDPSTVKSRYK